MQRIGHYLFRIIHWLAGLRDFVAASTDLYAFAARVELSGKQHDGLETDAFDVQMRGRIHTPADNYDTDVQVEIKDITESRIRPMAVLCTDSRRRGAEGAAFCLRTHNGIVPRRNAVLGRWKIISQIDADTLRFPRRGQRRLLFDVSVFSVADGKTLAKAQTAFDYFVEQDEGYIDFQKRQRRILGACVELGAAAAGFRAESGHRNLLSDWISEEGKGIVQGIEEFDREINGLESGRPADEERIDSACRTLLERAPANWRLKAAELCLRLAAVSAPAPPEQVEFVWGLGNRLEIEPARMRMLMDKLLPVHLQEKPNLEIMLGISEGMSSEEICRHLTDEYRKWNARVNHPDEAVRRQADMMLSLLAQVRSKYGHIAAEL